MEGRSSKWVICLNEVKTVSLVAAPMVVVTVLQFLVQFVATMMVGHLDQLSLSAASIGAAFSLVTGFTVLAGMAGGLETLCGQAYGAEQYHKLGTYMYCAITSMTLVCIPISILWIFTDKLLILAGQDHLISVLARKYSICLVPGLFGSAMLQAMTRYFQTQSLILPMLFASLATMCLHVPLCWFLVFKTGLRYLGAALAVSLSTWANVILLVIYMTCSSKCAKTLSNSLEWWSYDLLILLAGLLPNPKLESSVISICHPSHSTVGTEKPYMVCWISTRVSNELGAGKPKAAKMAVEAVMILAVMELAVVILPLFLCRHILGYVFSNDKEIVEYVADMAPFMCLSATMDTLQSVLSGVVRGSGKQNLGAFVNLGAYYVVGTPLAAILAFVAHLRGKGLLIGLATGSGLQAAMFAFRIITTDWEQQSSKARERIFQAGEAHGP
ncbi:Protein DETOXIFICATION 14 [Linum perenne]